MTTTSVDKVELSKQQLVHYPFHHNYNEVCSVSQSAVTLSSEHPEASEYLDKAFPSLPLLANAFMAIENLHKTGVAPIKTTVEAFDYLKNYDEARPGISNDGILAWRDYMQYLEKQLNFSPDFSQWDKNTKELERVAKIALALSVRVVGEHQSPEKRLPELILSGIYARVGLLQRWIKNHLITTRETEEYKAWAAALAHERIGSQVRRRVPRRPSGADLSGNVTKLTTREDTSFDKKYKPQPKGIWASLQDDLMLWIVNLAVFLSCAILQSIAFGREKSRVLSSSDFLAATQSALTQVLAIVMTCVLTSRQHGSHSLGLRHKVWILIAVMFPVAACIVLGHNASLSALLMVLGNITTGFLQVILAGSMKRQKLLP